MQKHPEEYFPPKNNNPIPQPPASPRSGSPNPLYAGEECSNLTLNTQLIGSNTFSEEEYYNILFKKIFAEMTKNPKAVVKELRNNPRLLKEILGSPIRNSMRERLIQKLCAAADRL